METPFKTFVGIDVSKKHLDAALIINQKYSAPLHLKFTNNADGFGQFLLWLKKQGAVVDASLLLVIEHTGLYQNHVVNFCVANQITLRAEQAKHIRWSLGFQRGKTDKLDAVRIAQYGFKNRETLTSQEVPPPAIGQLKRLLAQRDRMVNVRKQMVTSLKELEGFVDAKEIRQLEKNQASSIKAIEAAIVKIEDSIMALLKENPDMYTNYKLLISIKGIGMVTAWNLLVYTVNFTRYAKAKQLACYCGVAPFSYQSGTSVKGKTRVNHMANKNLKALLHMAAVCAIQHDAYLKHYYQRKILEGKHPMSAINAVRNKMVRCICAVVERKTPYVENLQKGAA